MQDTDLAWLAGIWDGEGTITMFTHREKTGNTKLCPVVCIVNTDIHIINKVRSILEELNCFFSLQERKPLKSHYKQQWSFITRNMKYIKILLENINPFLVGEKKAKGEILLSYVKQRMDKMERLPSKGSTPYDKIDWDHFTEIRSSQTTREEPFEVKI